MLFKHIIAHMNYVRGNITRKWKIIDNEHFLQNDLFFFFYIYQVVFSFFCIAYRMCVRLHAFCLLIQQRIRIDTRIKIIIIIII